MDEVFSGADYAQAYPEGIEHHFWNVARNKLLYRELAPLVTGDQLVMDVGCGPGIFLGSLQGTPINARGVEMGVPVVQPGLESVIDTATDVFKLDEATRESISVVLLLDVIEHIAQRGEFLKQIYSALPNCNYLLITVPARQELWSNYDEHWGHHRRYNRQGLADDLADTGFTPIKTRYCFNWIYLALLMSKWLGVKRGSGFKSPHRNRLLTVVHKALGALTRLEARLMPGCVAGSSIVCVARRNQEAGATTAAA